MRTNDAHVAAIAQEPEKIVKNTPSCLLVEESYRFRLLSSEKMLANAKRFDLGLRKREKNIRFLLEKAHIEMTTCMSAMIDILVHYHQKASRIC